LREGAEVGEPVGKALCREPMEAVVKVGAAVDAEICGRAVERAVLKLPLVIAVLSCDVTDWYTPIADDVLVALYTL